MGKLALGSILTLGVVVTVLYLVGGKYRSQRDRAKAEVRSQAKSRELTESVSRAVAQVRQANEDAQAERETRSDRRAGRFGTFADRVSDRPDATGVQSPPGAELTDD